MRLKKFATVLILNDWKKNTSSINTNKYEKGKLLYFEFCDTKNNDRPRPSFYRFKKCQFTFVEGKTKSLFIHLYKIKEKSPSAIIIIIIINSIIQRNFFISNWTSFSVCGLFLSYVFLCLFIIFQNILVRLTTL